MNSKKFFSPILLVSFALLNIIVSTFADEGKNLSVKTCQGQPIQLDTMRVANTTCRMEMKDMIKLPPNPSMKDIKNVWKNYCFMACIWEKLGVVVNGTVSSPGTSTYISTTFPPIVRSTLTDGFNACTKLAGTAGFSKADECKSYKPFFKCIKKLTKTACRNPGATINSGTSASGSSGRRRRQTGSTDSDEDDDDSAET